MPNRYAGSATPGSASSIAGRSSAPNNGRPLVPEVLSCTCGSALVRRSRRSSWPSRPRARRRIAGGPRGAEAGAPGGHRARAAEERADLGGGAEPGRRVDRLRPQPRRPAEPGLQREAGHLGGGAPRWAPSTASTPSSSPTPSCRQGKAQDALRARQGRPVASPPSASTAWPTSCARRARGGPGTSSSTTAGSTPSGSAPGFDQENSRPRVHGAHGRAVAELERGRRLPAPRRQPGRQGARWSSSPPRDFFVVESALTTGARRTAGSRSPRTRRARQAEDHRARPVPLGERRQLRGVEEDRQPAACTSARRCKRLLDERGVKVQGKVRLGAAPPRRAAAARRRSPRPSTSCSRG